MAKNLKNQCVIFYEQKNRGQNNFYCNKACLSKYKIQHTPRIKAFCFHCHKEINRTKATVLRNNSKNLFCSRSCAAIVNNTLSPKKHKLSKPKRCVDCNKEIHRRKRCSECSELYEKRLLLMTKADLTGPQIRSNARTQTKNLPQICYNCGYAKMVHTCHVIPIRNFAKTATISEINKSYNLVLLCPNCHWEFDHGRLKIGLDGFAPSVSDL